jgi:hypothetical protein
LPTKKGYKKVNNLHETAELTAELTALVGVEHVNYEFPGFWVIQTKDYGVYYLGDINGPWGWNDSEGELSGDTDATTAPAIAKAFSDYLEGLANARA